MNNGDVLAEVKRSLIEARDALGNPRMSVPAEAIITRGRSRRRGHRLMTGAAGLGLAAAVASSSLAFLTRGTPANQVDLKLAAWTVRTQGSGNLTLTLLEQSRSAAVNEVPQVREALAQAGVPAEVTFGSVCTSSASLPESVTQQVLPLNKAGQLQPYSTPSGGLGLTVVPSAMPPHTKLNISIDPVPVPAAAAQRAAAHGFRLEGWIGGATVVPASAVITCQAEQP